MGENFEGDRGTRFQKLKKSLIQNGGPNPHRKFQHSSSLFGCKNSYVHDSFLVRSPSV